MILTSVIGFVVIFCLVFVGVQFATKTGMFRVPGVVKYDESLSDEELTKLKAVLTDEIELDEDVTISATNYLELPTLSDGEFLVAVEVPVTDFYSLEKNIAVQSVDELTPNCNCGYELIDVSELDFTKRLLLINDKYYLDDFKSGAVFRVMKFESEKYEEEIAPLAARIATRTFPNANSVLTLAQTGVTAFSRLMNGKIEEVGEGKYFAEKIGPVLSKYDLTHTSNEASFTDYPSSSGATGVPICADWRFTETLTAIGLDIVELTGNHNQDCGDEAASATIDYYNERKIRIVGGGKTADEAAVPLEINQKSNKITMLAFNESTGGATYDDTPGANQYDEERARAQITAAKAKDDFVIVDVQYYECSEYASEYEDAACDAADSAAGDQVGFFRSLIDMGADVVVGTSAHQPQTYELYNGGTIYYGLGNLFFDQYRWPGTTRSLILVHHFYKDKLLQTQIMPTVYDADFQTTLMDEETSRWYLSRFQSVRP